MKKIKIGMEVQFTAVELPAWHIGTFQGLLPDGKVRIDDAVPLYDKQTVHLETKAGDFTLSSLWRYVPESGTPVVTWGAGHERDPLATFCEPVPEPKD